MEIEKKRAKAFFFEVSEKWIRALNMFLYMKLDGN